MSDIDRVELLIGLSQNLRKDNDLWRRDVWKEGREKAILCKEMLDRLEKEYGLLFQEYDTNLKQYMPKDVKQVEMRNEPVQSQTDQRRVPDNQANRRS